MIKNVLVFKNCYKIINNQKELKGDTKLYFMYYSRVVSILFSTGLHKSVFSSYSFGKTRFSSFVFLYLWFLIFSFALCFEFNVFLKGLLTLYNQGYIINHVRSSHRRCSVTKGILWNLKEVRILCVISTITIWC